MQSGSITFATLICAITPGQTFTLPEDWQGDQPAHDPEAPGDGFSFNNHTRSASAVIFKKVNDVMMPAYVSANGPNPWGMQIIVPKNSITFWFQQGSGKGNMLRGIEERCGARRVREGVREEDS